MRLGRVVNRGHQVAMQSWRCKKLLAMAILPDQSGDRGLNAKQAIYAIQAPPAVRDHPVHGDGMQLAEMSSV